MRASVFCLLNSVFQTVCLLTRASFSPMVNVEYWRDPMHHETDAEWHRLECLCADSFAELVAIAINELHKFPTGCELVCGPITTGGRGSVAENIAVFNATIQALQAQGRPIFSQLPYEERIFFFRKRWLDADPLRKGQYYMPILEDFYHPLIKTGHIKKGWFIPGWESSLGATWERQHLTETAVEVCDLSSDWVDEVLRSAQSDGTGYTPQ